MGSQENANGNGNANARAIGYLCTFLIGMVITCFGAFIAYPKDVATRQDIQAIRDDIQKEIDAMSDRQTRSDEILNQTQIDVGKLKVHAHMDDR